MSSVIVYNVWFFGYSVFQVFEEVQLILKLFLYGSKAFINVSFFFLITISMLCLSFEYWMLKFIKRYLNINIISLFYYCGFEPHVELPNLFYLLLLLHVINKISNIH